MQKNKHQSNEPYGLLGKAFYYTRDDLNANRAGYMTRAQQIGFNFMERKLFSSLLTVPPLKWLLGKKRRQVFKITGKVKKYYNVRFVSSGAGAEGGGGYTQALEAKSIEFWREMKRSLFTSMTSNTTLCLKISR